MPYENLVILRIQGNIVLFEIVIQVICPEDLRDLDQLVIVIMTMEEGFLPEDLEKRNTLGHRTSTTGVVRGLTIEANIHP